jgi:hypothetical protein
LIRWPAAVWVQTAEDCIGRLSESWHKVHLDHDLGGEVFVDSSRADCGMEVVRWLCNQPPDRFQDTLFIVHTYNSEAGQTMVSALRDRRYEAVYRPFGVDLLEWLPDDPFEEDTVEPDAGEPDPVPAPSPRWRDWLDRLLRRLRTIRRTEPGPARDDVQDQGPAA